MSEWVESPLSQLATFQKGRKVDTSPFGGDGYAPYLGASGLEGGDDGFATTRLAVIAKSTDTLMLWDGERSGLVGYGRQGVVASTVSKLSPSDKVEPKYLYYALSERFDWIQHRRTGTGVPHVPKDLGRLLKLRYPKQRTVQQRIATILTGIDTAIEKTEALIAKYQQIKAGLMHDLFTRGVLPNGQLRPPREQAPELYQETAIGWIPKEWDVVRAEELCAVVVDCPHSTPNYENEGYPCIRTADMLPGELLLELAYRVSDRAFFERTERLVPKSGDIIYSREGERLGIASPVGAEQICLGQRVMLLRPADKVAPQFLMWAMNMPNFYRQVVRGLGATTSPHINVGDIKRIFVPKPDLLEQQRIGEAIANAHQRVKTEESFREKLRKKKIGLMYDLLTDKVLVRAEEPEVVDG